MEQTPKEHTPEEKAALALEAFFNHMETEACMATVPVEPPGGNLDEQILEYWERPETVSIIDKNLHRIEIDTVCRHLLPTDHIADIGCGDGTATAEYARHVQHCTAIERSGELRGRAAKALSGAANATVREGDIMTPGSLGSDYDAIITQRVLINLVSWEQ